MGVNTLINLHDHVEEIRKSKENEVTVLVGKKKKKMKKRRNFSMGKWDDADSQLSGLSAENQEKKVEERKPVQQSKSMSRLDQKRKMLKQQEELGSKFNPLSVGIDSMEGVSLSSRVRKTPFLFKTGQTLQSLTNNKRLTEENMQKVFKE